MSLILLINVICVFDLRCEMVRIYGFPSLGCFGVILAKVLMLYMFIYCVKVQIILPSPSYSAKKIIDTITVIAVCLLKSNPPMIA